MPEIRWVEFVEAFEAHIARSECGRERWVIELDDLIGNAFSFDTLSPRGEALSDSLREFREQVGLVPADPIPSRVVDSEEEEWR